ncbi:ribokinase [Anaeramoeba ignava]|uniref:Ribokinase n=1 Tax=Anaeramoeba ignava TaxID=1746090 RepID=A0A9Q0R988_ANAIG|nr:ribokinase [Anaeramoeba ignava]
MENPYIIVVGSSNLDFYSYVEKHPKIRETIEGKELITGFGGKGANQAVMMSNLGGKVEMITRVGDDIFGDQIKSNYESFGVLTSSLIKTEKTPTGIALVSVNSNGQNRIVIHSGANGRLCKEDVEKCEEKFKQAKAVVTQLETPVEAALSAMKLGRKYNAITILNPAPAYHDLPSELFQNSDIVCPNETEAEIITGQHIETIEDATNAGKIILEMGAKNVVVTLGSKGCVWVTSSFSRYVPTQVVKVVDSTGSGDAFVGSFTYSLAIGNPILESLQFAVKVATMSVTKKGTQMSFPKKSELDGLI